MALHPELIVLVVFETETIIVDLFETFGTKHVYILLETRSGGDQ